MTKYILLLLSILTLNLTAFSQNVTDTNYIKLPTPVARQVVLDLIGGDKCKEELLLTQHLLKSTEKIVSIKDSIIGSYETKVNVCTKQISLYNEKEKTYTFNIKKLESKNKKLRFENKVLKTVGTTSLIIVATLFIVLK